jgi:glycosyltransferase involved in cell wall biosynthesis
MTHDRTRLLHITTVPVSFTFLHGPVDFVIARGVKVHALSSPGPELGAFGQRHDIPTYAVEMPRRITPLGDLRAVQQIIRVIRQVQPHIVHAHTPKGGLLGMIAAAAARVPVRIYHMRGLPVLGARGLKRVLLRTTERLSCRMAHRVICVSHSLRDVAIADRICSPDKITVLAGGSGQGVDATRFNPSRLQPGTGAATRERLGLPSNAVVMGFVGRLVRDKGVGELEAAWRVLRFEHPELRMLLVGPWEDQDPVPDGVRDRLEADPRVHLVGMDWNTPALYAAMDLVALPSYREGFPNVPLEAAAMGLPVVATDVPGCRDAVEDGVTGTLVPPRDTVRLTGALRSYILSSDLRTLHGAAGRERVLRSFRQEAIWEEMFEEYARLLEDNGVGEAESLRAGSSQ